MNILLFLKKQYLFKNNPDAYRYDFFKHYFEMLFLYFYFVFNKNIQISKC